MVTSGLLAQPNWPETGFFTDDGLASYSLMRRLDARQSDFGLKENGQHRKGNCAAAVAMEAAVEEHTPFRILKQP
jgi:hypothetical protein